jgi:hypothetical protein
LTASTCRRRSSLAPTRRASCRRSGSWARPRLRSRANQHIAAFVRRLRELGWIEGRNLAIEYRWADARSERFAEIADGIIAKQIVELAGPASGSPSFCAKAH